tara:strand:- start:5486 stop:6529 length:1044 start_codon:yes stop_codon:yes gene_type:complete
VKISVRTRGEPFEFDCAEGEKILHAGLRAGVGLPFECGSGTCGTCKAELGKGELDEGWQEAPGRAYVKEEKSEFLMCQASPRSDCTIGVRAKVDPLPDEVPVPGRMSGRITRFETLTHDVCRFEVSVGSSISFNAGQFMLVGTEVVEGQRAYSMSDYHASTETLEFVVKQVPDGGFTNWLFAGDRTGSDLDLFGPLGVATYAPSLPNNLVCIAGGSGLAPMLSILEHAMEAGHFYTYEGDLFFGVRTERDIYLLERLKEYARKAPDKLRITVVLSDAATSTDLVDAHSGLRFDEGFVHEATMRQMAGRWENVMAYLAGPPPMVDATLRSLVMEAKLTPAAIRYDKFS